MKKSIFLAAFVLFGFGAKAQEFNKSKMDSLFAVIEDHDKAMGSFSIFKNGKEVYQNSVGFSDFEKGTLNNADTKFRIGSISKTFTATIIMQMVEEGKLSLDTKLSSFYPEMPNASEITIEQMLGHRSGLFNFTDSPAYLEYMQEPKTKVELLKIFKDNGTSFKPAEKSDYSNTNYVLLSFIAEDIERKAFSEILNEKIIKPLRLKNTKYGGKVNTGANEAQSYEKLDNWQFATETDMSIPMGAGAIVSTPTDINKFYHALFSGKILKPASVEKMKTLKDGYGLGLFQFPFYEKKLYGHTGGIDNFSSMTGYILEDDLSFAFTLNGVDMNMNDFAVGMLSIYYGKDYEIPVFAPEIAVSEADLELFLGVYAAEGFPLKISITRDGNKLIAQGTGQPSFPLQAYGVNKFRFDRANLTMEFLAEENKMILVQNGNTVEMIRE